MVIKSSDEHYIVIKRIHIRRKHHRRFFFLTFDPRTYLTGDYISWVMGFTPVPMLKDCLQFARLPMGKTSEKYWM